MSRSVLLIDDDPDVRRFLTRFFERQGWNVHEAASGEEGMPLYAAELPDLVVLDLHLPGLTGLNVLEILVQRDAAVILLTGHGDIETAVEAMRLGAENFLTKPVEVPHLAAAAERAAEKTALRRANHALADTLADGRGPATLGRSPKMAEVGRQVRLVAASADTTVLLLGESGTGKGWAAQMIHALSPRAKGPFVEVNCAGLTGTFLESELFGHEKGAFTDAKTSKRGLFEVADGGTLFLDEIGDLSPEIQPKLLKVLEQKTFRRLGGTRELRSDVRLVAATNRDLEVAVREGRFREDLYYRLRVLPVDLPPLRERSRDDLLELIQRLLKDLASRHPNAPTRVANRALEALASHDWPGNVRELRNVLERALVMAVGEDAIEREHLPAELRRGGSPLPVGAPRLDSLEEVERQHIERTLRTLEGNRTQAAEVLGVSRATLHNKIKRYGLQDVGR